MEFAIIWGMEMKPMFESQDYVAIAHHLRVAAEQYKRDADVIRESELNENAKAQLIRNFEDQQKQCHKYADQIDERY